MVLAGWQWNSVDFSAYVSGDGIGGSTPVTAFGGEDGTLAKLRFDIVDSIARAGDFVAGGIHIDHEAAVRRQSAPAWRGRTLRPWFAPCENAPRRWHERISAIRVQNGGFLLPSARSAEIRWIRARFLVPLQ